MSHKLWQYDQEASSIDLANWQYKPIGFLEEISILESEKIYLRPKN